MNEFGSDFHSIQCDSGQKRGINSFFDNYCLFANGRQCLLALIKLNAWKRLWMPQYFCYEVIAYLQKELEIITYIDLPGAFSICDFSNCDFQEGDALLVMNFFGLRDHFEYRTVPVPIIEDHSHDLIGGWAQKSQADWCFASLRKTLPIPEGGIVWSPKGHMIPSVDYQTEENKVMATERWHAMDLKTAYLNNSYFNKERFRELFISTEEKIGTLAFSTIDPRSENFLLHFDIEKWYASKKSNWILLKNALDGHAEILSSNDADNNVFSLILLFESRQKRDQVRKDLISKSVYSAILWQVPDSANDQVRLFSERMLSVHCDGRYNEEEISLLLKRILTTINNHD